MCADYQDCQCGWDGRILTVGNAGIMRRWDLTQGAPAVESVREAGRGVEWVGAAPYRDSFHRADLPLAVAPCVTVTSGRDDRDGTAQPHLWVTVTLVYPNAELVWTHRVWPGLPLIMSGYTVRKTGAAPAIAPEKFYDPGRLHLHPADDRLDFFGVAPLHLAYQAVRFVAQSDYHDNLVVESAGYTYPKELLRPRAHLLHLRDRLGAGGLLALKIAPPADEQLHYPGYDFSYSGLTLAITGTGLSTAELDTGVSLPTYEYAMGVTTGDLDGGTELFHQFMRCLYPPCPERNFSILSNTWGDGNGSKKVGEAMMAAEIRAGADLGLTHCQIDAGWQKGNFADLGVEENRPKGPYGIDPDFWAVHPQKFPRGLAPVAALARECGVQLGLWFNPDGTRDYANWRKDADVILALWRAHGFQNVKLDGVSILSKQGEINFLKMVAAIFKESAGAICMNFDITGGKSWRLGHFYRNDFFGNLFIENRYALDQTYYPYRTLRNLWQLSRYLPSYRLQMEFVNPEIRQANYGDDPLAPAAFGAEFSCAVTLFGNPLCWMETQNLAASDRARLKKLLHAYRPHQHAILTGRVYPIGEEPSGTAWTGFQSVCDEASGYLIVYRELNDRPQARFKLHGLPPGATLALEPMAGHCRARRARVGADGRVTLALAQPCSYALLRYMVQPKPE